MNESKPSVYVLLATQTRLTPVRGDIIETIKFCTALSLYFNVYYNDQLFLPDEPGYGLKDIEIKAPTRRHDIYYVRANFEIFKLLPSPKVLMAYPYDHESFQCATALITTTEAWKQHLLSYNTSEHSRDLIGKWYPKIICDLPQIININQYINPWISEYDQYLASELKTSMGYGRIFGYYGRIDNESIPYIFQACFPRLQEKYPDIELCYAGKLRKGTNGMIKESKYVGQIAFEHVPSLTRTAFATLVNEEQDAEYLGSGKVLDSIGANIPIVTKKNSVREYQLGKEYPCFYSNEDNCFAIADRLLSDQAFYLQVKKYLADIAPRHSLQSYAHQLHVKFGALLSGHLN